MSLILLQRGNVGCDTMHQVRAVSATARLQVFIAVVPVLLPMVCTRACKTRRGVLPHFLVLDLAHPHELLCAQPWGSVGQ